MSMAVSSTSQTTKLQLSLSFQEELAVSAIHEKVMNMKSPQVMLWYFGANGVKEEGVTFYRDNFMNMLKFENHPTLWLYDLTAWAGLKNCKIGLDKTNSIVDQVQTFHEAIRCVKSNYLFHEIQTMSGHVMEYFRNHIVGRESLRNASHSFKDNHIKVREVFKSNCPVLEPIYDIDTSKAYSVLQYMELFFLIEKMISEKIDQTEAIDVVFALPNDESKYYQDSRLEEELQKFLTERMGAKVEGKSINVHVLCFNYGTDALHRPYNAPGKVLKKSIARELVL